MMVRRGRPLLTGLAMVLALAAPAAALTFRVNSGNDRVDLVPGDRECFTGHHVVTGTPSTTPPGEPFIERECTLRAAIQEVNTTAGEHTIVLPSGVYVLTLGSAAGATEEDDAQRFGTRSAVDAAAANDLDLDAGGGSITIAGEGETPPVIDGNGTDRVFHIVSTERSFPGTSGGTFGVVTLSNLVIRNGRAPVGAGILVRSANQVDIEQVTVTDSHSSDLMFGVGGGIYVDGGGGVVSIRRSTISSNSAAGGGGIFNRGSLRVEESRITENWTTMTDHSGPAADRFLELSGGGIANQSNGLGIWNTTIDHNHALSNGGGLSNLGRAGLINVTLSNNTADRYGGAVSQRPYPTTTDSLTTLSYSTIAANRAPNGPALHVLEGQIACGHCLIAIHSRFPCHNSVGEFVSRGHNLVEGGGGCFSDPTDLSGVNALLEGLRDNGGPTPTRAIPLGSPAVDAGTTRELDITRDQRGFTRPQGRASDIGAYELQPGVDPGDIDVGVPMRVDHPFPALIGFRVAMRLDKAPAPAIIVGVQPGDFKGDLTIEIAKDGLSAVVTGQAAPPKPGDNTGQPPAATDDGVLFVLQVRRPARGTAHLDVGPAELFGSDQSVYRTDPKAPIIIKAAKP